MTSQDTKKTTGTVLDDGTVIEMVHDRINSRTALIRFANDGWSEEERIARPGLPDLVAYSAENPLVEDGVVRFPSKPEPYENDAALTQEIRSFIHRYVDLSETFEMVATAYVLFSWVYDAFNELPYLRVRGDYGSGKTRFLTVVGSILYKPIFGSGASTVSPIFHLLEEFGGSLVIDEADFRFSDEKADLVKILNNGNVRGFRVLRAVGQRNGEFRPRAFNVYGPKIIASRGRYDDKGLESRFIEEEMGDRPLRGDIAINLPKKYEAEAEHLRNKLLTYRFRHRATAAAAPDLVVDGMNPRRNQILVPLLSVVDDATMRRAIVKRVEDEEARRRDELADTTEAKVVTILCHLFDSSSKIGVSVGDVAALFRGHVQEQDTRPMTDRRMGMIIRTRLGLHTQKSHGRFVVMEPDRAKLSRLCERFGVDREDVKAFEERVSDRSVREAGDQEDMGSSGRLN